jgi:hypothetical protein
MIKVLEKMEYKAEKKTINDVSQENKTMNYDNFMIFECLNNGERQRVNITEEKFRNSKGAGILHPKQMIIIVKEDIRRIYIWKGTEPHVRKKFIASRIAQELQGELIKRCKIVTVDQGEELTEFLNVFGFDQKELAKISGFDGQISNRLKPELTRQAPTSSHLNKNQDDSKAMCHNVKLEENEKSDIISKLKILEEVLSNDIPKDFKRKNILIGENTLYGLTIKKVKIFGQDFEETEWEPVKNLPNGIFELEGRKVRIYHSEKRGIRAIEILEPAEKFKKLEIEPQKEKPDDNDKAKVDYNKWSVKKLKEFCFSNKIKVRSGYRKAEIVKLVEEFQKKKN